MKRLFLIGIGTFIVAVVIVMRGSVLERIDIETRHHVIAVISRFNAPSVITADEIQVTPIVHNPVGVNTFLEQEVDVELRRRTVEMIRDAGIGWMRQQFPWDNIEPVEKGRYIDRVVGVDTWEKYDAIVALAEEMGPRLIIRLDTSPPWARPGNAWPATPPDDLADYGDFVEGVARRYRGRVQHYQIWNEPNLTSEWGNKPVNASEYVELLKLAHSRIKRADPDALVLSAALAPTIEESTSAQNELKYLDEMYRLGAAPYFDILSVQAYGLRSGPDDRRLEDDDVNFSRSLLIRELMVRHHDARKPIWAAEVGWNAQPSSLTKPAIFGRVSEELQSRYTVRALERARQEWPWMGVMAVWFFKRADYNWIDEPMYYFRMAEPDLTPRALYFSIQEYTRQRGLTSAR
ncbi:MAG: hypothetical protein ACKVVP_17940 [Chloroflexota bacterium]